MQNASSSRLTAIMHRLAAVFGSSLVLLFFSEYYFMNESPVLSVITALAEAPLRAVLTMLELALLYALLAYLLHLAVAHFEVVTLNGLFLAAVLFGWATESVYVPIAYEAVPISLIFPSVGWHALVDVLLGWYLVRRMMRLNRWWVSALAFVALGAVWGAWGTWFWAAPDLLTPLTPSVFTGYVFFTAAFWIAGMALLDRFGSRRFAPPRLEVAAVLLVTLFFFGVIAVPFLPFSLVLVVFIGVTLLALRRSARHITPAERNILRPLYEARPQWWNYALALLAPGVAALVYPLFFNAGVGIPTEDITFLLLMVGTVWLLVGWVRPFLRRTSEPSQSSPAVE